MVRNILQRTLKFRYGNSHNIFHRFLFFTPLIRKIVITKVITKMQTRLIPIGNSYGIRLPKSIIKQFDLDKNNLEIVVKEDGIFITPIANVPPLNEWEKLFKEAGKKGFDAAKDISEFADWDITLNDGDEKL